MSVLEIGFALVLGLLAGGFAGLLGVGGGIVMVPAIVIVLERSQVLAQGTSLLVIVVTALAATRANMARGLLVGRTAVLLGIGGVVGAVGGSLLALDVLSEALLRRLFGTLVMVAALRIVLKRVRGKGADGAEGRRVP